MRRLWRWLTRTGGQTGAEGLEPTPPTPRPEPGPPTPQPPSPPPTPPQPEPTPQPPSPGPEPPPPPQAEDEPDPRAASLRERIEEAKAAGSDRDEFESGETPVDDAEPVLDLEARRRAVHDEARTAIEEMRGGPGDSAA